MAKPSSVSLKILIDSQEKRVLFAEAGKDAVDFLFHILSLPLATVVNLLRKRGMVGSLPKLYRSVETLNHSYLQSDQTKDSILRPTVVLPHGTSSVPLLLSNQDSSQTNFFSRPNNCHSQPSFGGFGASPLFGEQKERAASNAEGGGYVKGVVTYMVMDDLQVKPMSTISSLTLLSKFNVRDVKALEERVVNLDMSQAVMLLKASLQSDHVLTDVFLHDGKQPAANGVEIV